MRTFSKCIDYETNARINKANRSKISLREFSLLSVLQHFSMRWSKPVNAFQGINMAIAYVLVPLQMYPEYLFGLSFGFLLFGLTWGFLRADHAVNEESSAN